MKPKILMLSDNPLMSTGYSSQALFLLNGLSDKGWECHLMAHNYIGQVLPEGNVKLADGTPFKFTLYPNGLEAYCKDLMEHRIREIRPDIFLVLLDTFMVYPWILEKDLAPAIPFFWTPSDGGRFPIGCENILRKFNPIMMAKFGQKQIKDYYNIDSIHIPHAINSNIFSPLSDEEKKDLRKNFVALDWNGIGHKGILHNKFVVGMMGRNQPRKMHDRAFKIFAKFARDHEDAVLLCHFDLRDPAGFCDLRNIIFEYRLQNKIFFTGTRYFQGFTYEKMREVYNLMDVYLSSSSGEGFGIGTIEAMSCEVPVLNTRYTTTEELVIENNAGLGLKLSGCPELNLFEMHSRDFDDAVMNGTLTGSWNVERGLVDIDDGVLKLKWFHHDRTNLKSYGLNGRKAVLEKYDIPIIVDSFDKLFKEALK